MEAALNDMVNLDQPVVIQYGDRELFNGHLPRTMMTMWETLETRGDASYVFAAEKVVLLNEDPDGQ